VDTNGVQRGLEIGTELGKNIWRDRMRRSGRLGPGGCLSGKAVVLVTLSVGGRGHPWLPMCLPSNGSCGLHCREEYVRGLEGRSISRPCLPMHGVAERRGRRSGAGGECPTVFLQNFRKHAAGWGRIVPTVTRKAPRHQARTGVRRGQRPRDVTRGGGQAGEGTGTVSKTHRAVSHQDRQGSRRAVTMNASTLLQRCHARRVRGGCARLAWW
jgi:hypothetical protein